MRSRSAHQLYSQFPLQSKFIRLLKPEHTATQSPLKYKFEVVELHHAPAFDALSYVWGERTMAKKIMVEGTVLSVTDNLLRALSKIRNASAPCHQDRALALLWVDQICINQSNVPELSAQVDMMASLYSLATTVIIDLGEAEDDSEAVQLVNDMAHYIREQESFGQYFDQWPYLAGEENERLMKLNWPSFGSMLSSAWFHRAWVVEENVGGQSGYRPGIKPNYDSPLCDVYVDFAKWWLEQNGRSHILSCVNHVSGPLRRNSSPSRSTSSNTTKTKAVARLRTSAGAKIPSQEKYPRRCEAHDHPKTVSLLEKKRTAALQQTGCPSWCPRWDWLPLGGTRLDKAQNEAQASWTACGESKFVYQFLSGNQLEVAGKCFDTVSRVMPTLNDIRQELGSESESWRHTRKFSLSDDSIDTIYALSQLCWRVLECESKSRSAPSEQIQKHRLSAFAAAATASFDWALSAKGQGPLADFAASVREVWSSRRADGDNSSNGNSSWRKNSSISSSQAALDVVHGLTQQIDVSSVAPARFPMAATRMCESRQMFATAGGRIGFGPEWLGAGDICCIVSRAGVPYMLRSARSRDAHYLLVGECYVYGAMGGEIVQEHSERCGTEELWQRIVLE